MIIHIIHTYYIKYILSHEMILQCTGGLDFIFNGIEQNSALEISDQSSKCGKTLKLATFFFVHVSENCS